jgi:hypothetical protein
MSMLSLGVLGLASVPGALWAAGGAASSGGVDINQVLAAGVTPVAVLILMIAGQIHPKGVVEVWKARAENAEKKAEALQELMTGQVVPALTLDTQVMNRLAPLLEAELATRRAGGG